MTRRSGESPTHVVQPKGFPDGSDGVELATGCSEVCVSPKLVVEPASGSAPGGKCAPTSAGEVRRVVSFCDDGAKDEVFDEGALVPIGEEETFMEAMDRRDAEEAEEVADAANRNIQGGEKTQDEDNLP